MSAEIIAIGSELTSGTKLDTNSQWLSRELEVLGWTTNRHTTVADDQDGIAREFFAAAQRSRIVLITGGLGPTLDDITRDAMAQAFNQSLITDEACVQQIEAMFAARGRVMPDRNRRQAQRPEHATAIRNLWGTAPGVLMHVDIPGSVETQQPGHQCTLAAMPGVPAEMKPMFEQHIKPLLPASGIHLHRHVIHSFGFGESDAERLLGELTARGRNPEVGITASEAVISLWISSRATNPDECLQMSLSVQDQIRHALGSAVFAEGNVEMHQVVSALLQASGMRVACIEGTTTGGLITQWLSEDPATAACLADSVVYGNMLDRTVVPDTIHDWSSWAQQKANQILQNTQADLVMLSSPQAVATTADQTTIKRGAVAIGSASGFDVRDVTMTGNVAIFRQRAARTALNLTRLLLLEASRPDTAT